MRYRGMSDPLTVCRDEHERRMVARERGISPHSRQLVTVEGILNGALRGRDIGEAEATEHAWNHPRISEVIRAVFEARKVRCVVQQFLFVGGPSHGQRRQLRGDEWSALTVVEPLREYKPGGYVYDPIRPDIPSMRTSRYTREKVGMRGNFGSRRTLDFMRHESLSRETAAEVALDLIWTEAGGRVD